MSVFLHSLRKTFCVMELCESTAQWSAQPLLPVVVHPTMHAMGHPDADELQRWHLLRSTVGLAIFKGQQDISRGVWEAQAEAKQTNKIGEVWLKSKAYLSPLLKPVRAALCKEKLLQQLRHLSFLSGCLQRLIYSLCSISCPFHCSPQMWFFFVLLQKHSCLSNSLQHEEQGEEIKTLQRVERYLMFQSGSEGGFSSFKMPFQGGWANMLGGLSGREGWGGAGWVFREPERFALQYMCP